MSRAHVHTTYYTIARLKLLRDWTIKGFSCCSIRIALEHIQRLLAAFEGRAGDIGLAAGASEWLAIRDAVKGLLRPSSRFEGKGRAKERRTHQKKRLLPPRSTQQAVLCAVTALGGNATNKQVRAYLSSNPSAFGGADPSMLGHSIENIRLSKYCELCGKNQAGEDVFRPAAAACPRGVRRDKKGFRAQMQCGVVDATCMGPNRTSSHAASRDYEELRQWRATMEPEALLQRVRAWDDAYVIKARLGARKREGGKECYINFFGWHD